MTTPVAGYLISLLRRAKFVLEIRDLQPESGVQFGNLQESFFTRSLRGMMRFLYRRADRIVTVTSGINDYLRESGIPATRLVTVKSGVGDDFIHGHSNGIRVKFGWEDKFLVIYSGTLGWVRPLETIVESAKLLAERPDIHFVFVGDGQKREELEALTKRHGLSNVTFTDNNDVTPVTASTLVTETSAAAGDWVLTTMIIFDSLADSHTIRLTMSLLPSDTVSSSPR